MVIRPHLKWSDGYYENAINKFFANNVGTALIYTTIFRHQDYWKSGNAADHFPAQ
jgi:hypothetical protein